MVSLILHTIINYSKIINLTSIEETIHKLKKTNWKNYYTINK
jgi:hypothetical protein